MDRTSAACEPGWEGVFTDFDGSKHYVWIPVEQTDDGDMPDFSRAVMPPGWTPGALQSARSRLRANIPSASTTTDSCWDGDRSRHSA